MIPNTLWQTWRTKSVPESVKQFAESWTLSNPQLKIKLYNDQECSDFILEHFGAAVHELYLALPQPIMRADFWRIAVIYVHGGYYADLDVDCLVHLDNFVDPDTNAVFVEERNNVANFFFGAAPKHPVLKNVLDMMIKNAKHAQDFTVQNFGMHPLHHCVGEYFGVVENTYQSSQAVCFLNAESLFTQNKLKHMVASQNTGHDYVSWRDSETVMNQRRELCDNILFFTTFNKNGYELYGKKWIDSFVTVANYYNKVRAKIYYEGFVPDTTHPSIEWVNYETAVPKHAKWKQQYLKSSTHSDYVKTMTVRFSHKAFVMQHVLDQDSDDYLIWLDGDCVFKPADYSYFPSSLLNKQFLACQVEHAHELNHVESGILIFQGAHPATGKFNRAFKKNYAVKNILQMRQPYDGFVIFKSLLDAKLKYVDLNADHGAGGIQSDPSMTFCHPDIKNKFVHNIGWTGKTQYDTWESVLKRDTVYQRMKSAVFNFDHNQVLNAKKKRAHDTLQKLKCLKLK